MEVVVMGLIVFGLVSLIFIFMGLYDTEKWIKEETERREAAPNYRVRPIAGGKWQIEYKTLTRVPWGAPHIRYFSIFSCYDTKEEAFKEIKHLESK